MLDAPASAMLPHTPFNSPPCAPSALQYHRLARREATNLRANLHSVLRLSCPLASGAPPCPMKDPPCRLW